MKKYFAILLCLFASPAFAIEKNVASQYLELQAIDSATGAPKTGDAANLTAYYSLDAGTLTALTDTSATEVSSTNAPGVYRFDLAQAETNGTNILYSGKSSTSGVYLVPRFVWTAPSGFSTLTIANNATAANITRVSGSAVSTSSAQLGVNAVNIGGTAQTGFDATGRIQTALPSIAPDAAGGLSTNLQGPRVYYVQSTGSDSNSGLIRTSPLLNPPTSAARNGDIIHFIGSNSFSGVNFAARRVKIEGDRASNTTLTITSGAGLIVASGSEICDIKIVNSNAVASSRCIDLAGTDFVNIHDVILDAGSGDQCLNLNNSAGIRLSRSKLTSVSGSGIEGYAVNIVEENAGTGGATSIVIDECYITGGRAAVYMEDRSVAEIKNSRLIASYGVANANSVGAILCDEHYNQGPTFRVLNTRLEATTSGSHTGVVAGITHWTNTSGAADVAQVSGEVVGGSVAVTAAAGSTTKHIDVHVSGSLCKVRGCNHDTTKDGTYVQAVDEDVSSTKTRALLALPSVAPASSGGVLLFGTSTGAVNPTSGKVDLVTDAINSGSVATSGATEIGSAGGAGTPAQVNNQEPVKAFTAKLGTRADGTTKGFPTLRIKPAEKVHIWLDCSALFSANIGNVTNAASSDTDVATIDDSGMYGKYVSIVLDCSDASDGDTATITADVVPQGASSQVIKAAVDIVIDAN